MKRIELTKEDIKEVENIINCLKSKDKETFCLGKSLLETKFGIDFYIPSGDILIPFKHFYDTLQYSRLFIDLDVSRYGYNYTFDFACRMLKHLIIFKYYVIP